MTRNEEMAAILRAAANGAKPLPTLREAYDSEGRRMMCEVFERTPENASYYAVARILHAMAAAYETFAKSESLAEEPKP